MKASERFVTSKSKPKELEVYMNRVSSYSYGILLTFGSIYVAKESTRYMNIEMTKDEAFKLGLRLLEIAR